MALLEPDQPSVPLNRFNPADYVSPGWLGQAGPIVPALGPPSPTVDEGLDRFWDLGPEFDSVLIEASPPVKPLALLEELGPSPFERGTFPLIGFLATTYEKVSRYALERLRQTSGNPDRTSR